MHGTLQSRIGGATKPADTSVSETSTDDRFVIDAGPQWFSSAARHLLAPKPGLVLHLQTDCGERNGHRYASGEVAVPSHVLRQLLRGRNGRQWLGSIMDGSDANWWHDYQQDERDAGKARAFVQDFTVADSSRAP